MILGSAGLDSATVSVLISIPTRRSSSGSTPKKDVVFQPALMSPHELLMGMEWAARQFYSLPSILERMARREPVCGGTWPGMLATIWRCGILARWDSIRKPSEAFLLPAERAFSVLEQ